MPLRIAIPIRIGKKQSIAKSYFPSCTSVTNKLFISSSIKPLYDDCGPLVRRETVALEKGVRFSPVVLCETKATQTNSLSVVLMKILRSKIESRKNKDKKIKEEK